MSLWVVFALFFTLLLVASGARATEKAPQQVYLLQVQSERQGQNEAGCLPLLLFIGVILIAVLML